MPPIPGFDPKIMIKDISRFNSKFKKLDTSVDGKEMLLNVKDFAAKAASNYIIDSVPEDELTKMASHSMNLIRLLPESLFGSPDSPVANQKKYLETASESDVNASLISLFMAAQAMVLNSEKNKADIDYVLQVAFGTDKASLAIRDLLTKPFGSTIEIPEFLTRTIKELEKLVHDGNIREWLNDGRKCGLQNASSLKLWSGRILEITQGFLCGGSRLTVTIADFQPDPNLELVLPLTGGGNQILNVESEIKNGNIVIAYAGPNIVTLTFYLPFEITSGDLYFQIPDKRDASCINFWSIMETARTQVNQASVHIYAGVPVIHTFASVQSGPVYPRQYVDLTWDVENADTIDIEILNVIDSPNPNELPPVSLSKQLKGTIHVNILCTMRWRGEYVLKATNGCGTTASKPVRLESGWSNFLIGTGIGNITDHTPGLGMLGFADELQKVTEVQFELFSRAFIISKNTINRTSSDFTVIVVADLWSCTQAVKTEVVKRLQALSELEGFYTTENVLITGTHTHSGPGGYSDYFLYNLTCGGFDADNFNKIVSGIVDSVKHAHNNLAPGRIYINSGTITEDCGNNRSIKAYDANLDIEAYSTTRTDKEMLLLRFDKDDIGQGNSYPVGVLNWYALHNTCLGQSNTRISGDNKGWASKLFEDYIRMSVNPPEPFVAAFANSWAGDISGSVDENGIITPHDNNEDVINMEKYGDIQFRKAMELFSNSLEELRGGIDHKYTHLDLTNLPIDGSPGARTWPAALGISFGAGSMQDGKATAFMLGLNFPSFLIEGITSTDLALSYIPGTVGVGVSIVALLAAVPEALVLLAVAQAAVLAGDPLAISVVAGSVMTLLPTLLTLGLGIAFIAILPWAVLSALAVIGLKGKLGSNPLPLFLTDGSPNSVQTWTLPALDPLNTGTIDHNGALFINGHSPKPIMFAVGNCQPFPLVPNIVPIQLLKIGQLVITGIPAEITTMSGRRLKSSINTVFGSSIDHIAIAAYSNGYSGYITTKEEYDTQQYEGASTLYGPNTLAAYQQEFSKLAQAIVNGNTISTEAPQLVAVVQSKYRGLSSTQLYVNNRTKNPVSIRIFLTTDEIISYNWPHESVPANENLLFDVPGGINFKVSVNNQISSTQKGGDIIMIQ